MVCEEASKTKKKTRLNFWILGVSALILGLLLDSLVPGFARLIQVEFVAGIFHMMESKIFIISLVIAAFVFLLAKSRKTAFNFLIASVLTEIMVFSLKALLHRERPFGAELFTFFNMPDYSFPSAHAAFSFLIFAFLEKDNKKLIYLWLSAALIISFSRIYISAHYLSDVIAGALLGYLIGRYFAQRK